MTWGNNFTSQMSVNHLRECLRSRGYIVSAAVRSPASGLWVVEVRKGLLPVAFIRLASDPSVGPSRLCIINLPTLARVERMAESVDNGFRRGLARIIELEPEFAPTCAA